MGSCNRQLVITCVGKANESGWASQAKLSEPEKY